MSQQIITFKHQTPATMPVSLGRNGDLKTKGVSIAPVGRAIWLQPLLSNGGVGRCILALPKDPKTLRELAAVLLLAAEDLEHHDDEQVA